VEDGILLLLLLFPPSEVVVDTTAAEEPPLLLTSLAVFVEATPIAAATAALFTAKCTYGFILLPMEEVVVGI
jgi:hypothetical protein